MSKEELRGCRQTWGVRFIVSNNRGQGKRQGEETRGIEELVKKGEQEKGG